MRIRQLRLRPYRNFQHLELELGRDGALILGDNGQGKSNILEAISYLSLGKSIRGSRDQGAVPHGGEYFDIHGVWEDKDRERQARVFYSSRDGKHAFLDEVSLARVSELVSQFHTVHFSPEDVSLVLQFSAQRRRLLDILISQASSEYLQTLQRYNHVLIQRNRCLHRIARRSADPSERVVWDGQLSVPGASIRRARLEALTEAVPCFARYYEEFSAGRERAGVKYRDGGVSASSGQVPSTDVLEQEMRDELMGDQEHEVRAGHTLYGPHRDNLTFTLDGTPAHAYGSQGQLKSLLISWKMAELRFLEARCGQQPVLLLDDVFSELDEVRTRRLLSLTDGFEQVILTAPRPPAADVGARFARIGLT